MRLIWKLLRKHISVFELAVFFVANLIGMAVILAGVQIYSDLSPLLTGQSSLIGNDYMIISRPVERVGGATPKITAISFTMFLLRPLAINRLYTFFICPVGIRKYEQNIFACFSITSSYSSSSPARSAGDCSL